MQARVFRKGPAVALCLLLSLLLHMGFVILLLHLPPRSVPRPQAQHGPRTVRLHRPAPEVEKIEQQLRNEPDKQEPKPFAKTDPDRAEQRPARNDFVGKRNARAASDAEAQGVEGESPLPSMTGEKKEEIVSFDQKRQLGDLEHDSRLHTPETPPPALPQSVPLPLERPASVGAGMQAVPPPPESPEGGLRPATATPPVEHSENGQKPAPRQQGADTEPQRPPVQPTPPVPRFYRDPSLADPTQAGFRTQERRSRNAGRFVLGRHAALNVSATPLGRYEAEIYRRIAYWWYRACDERRGDIIPGKIVVSLRLNSRGRLVNMDLIQRSGAGVIQQSFTFGAIRQASLPPMPPAVQDEMVGDLLELIFEFIFN